VRRDVAVALRDLATPTLRHVVEAGQEMLCPADGSAETVLELDGAQAGFDFGARFIEVRDGLAPDKLTAETRKTGAQGKPGPAMVEWSQSPKGPWKSVWTFPAHGAGLDGEKIDRVLRWPEAFVSVRDLPEGSGKIYVRVRTQGPCVDNVRASAWSRGENPAGRLRITHTWTEKGVRRQHSEMVAAGAPQREYRITAGAGPQNESLTLEALP
jgi:hypothetical protein